ncbi:ABC transporter permease [Roseiconus lacunae]|uniref:FtsX-like permease family protein n=1 Tax=Roseiconus lacunae TaxID=2605694 RepID=A0ABT7PLY2_9BACT|nr:ABC transporter permease [Roseiconus lacunae]MDM4017495.1 FtsX-like permease family protein [Roseiconus lacunae]
MSTLDRILIADVRHMWRQFLAIGVLLACGIAIFLMSGNTIVSLETSQRLYYNDGRFADVFVSLVRAPNRLASRVKQIPGVRRVQTRLVRDVLLDIPSMVEPASCKLVSIDPDPSQSLNRLFLRRGRMPRPTGRVEVVVSELFAEKQGFQPGDQVQAILSGRKETLTIVGIGLSPEFIYVVQPGLMVTDDRRYGVMWIPRRQMEAAFSMEGAFNDLSVSLRPKANVAEVRFQLDRLTRPYGGTDSYDRDDQPSHRRLTDEIDQMKTMAFVTPSIFMAVSAFLFNIVFSRLIGQQKEQIATLRAFGYLPREIVFHYIKMVAVLVGGGVVLGLGLGVWMSGWILVQYARFFRFPTMLHEFSYNSALIAAVLALTISLLGTYSAIRRASRLVPAEAMRPEAPRDYRGLWAERLGLARFLSPIGAMIVRRLETNRCATLLSVLGMSLGLAVLVLGSFMEDTVDFVIDSEFQRSQRQDVMLNFVETRSADAVHDAAHLPGVTRVEAFRTVPARINHGRRSYRVAIMGLVEHPTLYRILDEHQQAIRLPERGGLTITRKLAEILNAREGTPLRVAVLEGDRLTLELPVAKVFENYTEPGAYINRLELNRLLRESNEVSGVALSVAPGSIQDLYQEVKQTPSIAGAMDKQAAMENFRDLVAESTSVMRSVNAIFATLIAFGVIYNCAMIILSERSRDLATLRVMGFTRLEAAWVLLGEIAIITALSIPVGLLFGYAFAYLMAFAMDTESFRFPLVIETSTYAYSVVVILIAALVSSLYVRRQVNDLDMIGVLKVKE